MRTPVAQSRLRFLRRAAIVAPLVLAAACVSAEKRLRQGYELEQAGRPADAAARYIQALKKDPSLTDARARLQEVGDRAAADYLREVEFLDTGARAADAADVLLQLDELRRETQGVGVQLTLPADYGQRRRAVLDRAIADAVVRAEDAASRGQYEAALASLDRAVERWQPTVQQRAELDRARYDARLAWAEADLAAGRYRAAYDRAGRALSLFGAQNPLAEAAAEVQAEALRRGTVRVAVLPVSAEAPVRRKLPDDFFPELDDVLEEDHWARLPLFVEVIDPRTVRRERRHGAGRGALSAWEAERIGRQLGADVVVLAEVDSVGVRETDVTEQRRPIKTSAGADTAYVERSGRQELRTYVRWTLLEVETRRSIDHGTFSATGNTGFREARYAGDWRTLQLTNAQRDLFQDGGEVGYRGDRELVRELVAGVSERFERTILDRVVSMVQ